MPKKKRKKKLSAEQQLRRHQIEVEKMDPKSIRRCSPEESRELTESCPIFHIRMTGVERDGTPFDTIKKIRAPYKETAINILTVKATINYGCRVDSAEIIKQEGQEWPSKRNYRSNPITPNRLFAVLYRAIWPANDPGSIGEAETARDLAIRYLQDVTPADLPQLQNVLLEVWEGPAKQKGALDKFKEIYAIAAKTNRILPPTLAAFSKLQASSSTAPKSSTPPKTSSPPPTKPSSSPKKEAISPKQPESRATCRTCDGRGYTIRTNKDNIIKEGTKVTCSRCGGTGFEPGPSKGKGGRWRGSHQQQTEEEEDINRATDNFLKKHGFGKWGES